MPTAQALNQARSQGLDLVIISESAQPPVAKILDYKKFKYDESKKIKEQRKNMRAARIEIKELRFRPVTGQHDLDIMIKQAEKFLDKGNRVKFSIRTRGRESQRMQDHLAFMKKVLKDMNIDFVSPPQLAGRQVYCIVERAEKKTSTT